MQKRSVLFINDSLWNSSGVFRSLLSVLRYIDYAEYDVTLYLSAGAKVDAEAQNELPKQLRLIVGKDGAHPYRNVFVFTLHTLSLLFSVIHLRRPAAFFQKLTRRTIRRKKYKRQAKAYFKSQQFDVAVANTLPVCAEIAKYIHSEKKYVVFHSSRADFFPEITKQAFQTFNGVIAVSEGIKQMLSEHYPDHKEKIVTITNFVDAEEIRRKAEAAPLPPPNGRVRLCTCGRLSPEKGFDLAVKTARILKDHGLAFDWYFVGDGPEKKRIETSIQELGLSEYVHLAGFLQNPYPYTAGCDVYVQPSYEEAQPLAVMEAQILGKAVVSTDTVGGRTILENGRKGVLTPITAEGLAEGIEALLADPDRRRSLENLYAPEDNLRAKQAYAAAWDRLLSE